MPLYTFQCDHKKCNHQWETVLMLAAYRANKEHGWRNFPCPRCGTTSPHIVPCAPAVIGAKSIVLPAGAAGTPIELEGREFKSWAEVDAAKASMGLVNCGDSQPLPPKRKRISDLVAEDKQSKATTVTKPSKTVEVPDPSPTKPARKPRKPRATKAKAAESVA